MNKVIWIVDLIVMVMLTIYATLFCIPTWFGIKPVNVLSGSMEPYIKTGSIVYVRETNIDEIHRDDVIAYELENKQLVLHRVKKISPENEITTQGDANDNEDFTTVSENQLKGKMIFQIPYTGLIYQNVTCKELLILLVLYAGVSTGYKLAYRCKESSRSAEDEEEEIRL